MSVSCRQFCCRPHVLPVIPLASSWGVNWQPILCSTSRCFVYCTETKWNQHTWPSKPKDTPKRGWAREWLEELSVPDSMLCEFCSLQCGGSYVGDVLDASIRWIVLMLIAKQMQSKQPPFQSRGPATLSSNPSMSQLCCVCYLFAIFLLSFCYMFAIFYHLFMCRSVRAYDLVLTLQTRFSSFNLNLWSRTNQRNLDKPRHAFHKVL